MTEETPIEAMTRRYKGALEDACKDAATIDALKARVAVLEAAIREHKAECCTGYAESCDIAEANEKLWSALGGEGEQSPT